MLFRIFLILATFLALAASPARATDSHEYAKDEYGIISAGLAPNKHLSLAAHGEGELGDSNFHVWLMAEPAHRKLAVLPGISSDNNLDTGPGAYYAMWSKDSRRAAVSFRRDRHEIQLNIYEIDGGRARLTTGPSLFKDVTSRDIGKQEDIRNASSELDWTRPNSFHLSERMLVKTTDAAFLRMLGKYGKLSSKENDGALFVEFSAEADCVIGPGNRYRILNIKVGEFTE